MCGYHRQWTLGELLADELTQAVMLADHVDTIAVETLVSLMRRRREHNQLYVAPHAVCTTFSREGIF